MVTLLQAPQTLKGRGVLQYLYNFNDLEKMGQILEKHQLPRLIWDKLITWIIPYHWREVKRTWDEREGGCLPWHWPLPQTAFQPHLIPICFSSFCLILMALNSAFLKVWTSAPFQAHPLGSLVPALATQVPYFWPLTWFGDASCPSLKGRVGYC